MGPLNKIYLPPGERDYFNKELPKIQFIVIRDDLGKKSFVFK